MMIAISGASGRTDATHASLLAARAAAIVDGRATLLVPADVPAPGGTGTLRIARIPAGAPARAIAREAEGGRADGSTVVADLPSGWLRRDDVRAGIDIAILAVGPHEADEREAAAWTYRAGSARPIVYLGCRRAGGGPAAARFAATMAALDAGTRVAPYVVPPLGRGEAAALSDAAPRGRTLRSGMLLLAAIRRAATQGHEGFVPLHAGVVDEAERVAITGDARRLADRLRDLADDVDAVEAGLGPTAADLADAPVLDLWAHDIVLAPVLKGIVSNHPSIPDGRPARTTEVFLSDRATYARTLSRWYVLRRAAGSTADALQ